MNINNDKLINIVTDYLLEDRYTQAILIDGKWGTGKTFFVKEKLIPTLKNDSSLKYTNIYYLSLYDIKDLNELTNKIYLTLFENFFKNKIGEKRGKNITNKLNLFSKAINIGLNALNNSNILGFNITKDDLPKFEDLIDLKNISLFLDDVERCKIDINELLSFINILTEQNNIKVILIANEEEINHIQYYNNLPEKYMLALNKKINFDKLSTDDNTKKEKLDKEQLTERIHYLFSAKDLYAKTKEKTIMLTINYNPNFEDLYDTIVEKYCRNEQLQKRLLKYKSTILDIFKQKNHTNIRTLIFGIISLEKLYPILTSISYTPRKYLNKEIYNCLKSTFTLAIKIKSKHINNLNYDNITDSQYVDNSFIFEFMLYHHLDENKIKENLIYKIKHKNLAFNKLQYYSYLKSDEEVYFYLKQLYNELTSSIYPIKEYPSIISRLLKLKSIGFTIDLKIYQNCMIDKIDSEENISFDILENFNKNARIYNITSNTYIKNLKKSILNKLTYLPQAFFLIKWDNDIITYFKEHQHIFYLFKEFLSLINIDMIIKKLIKADKNEVSDFSTVLYIFYHIDNANEYFTNDLDSINYLLNKLRKNTSRFYMFNNSLSLLKKQEIDYLINNLESYKNKLSSSKN